MGACNQFAQLVERSEVFFNRIEVLWVVTVETGAGLAFLQFDLIQAIVIVIPGCKPDGRDAEFFQIAQAVNNSLEISAVVVVLVLPIVEPFRLRRIVVRRITVAETIDHGKVHHIVRREASEATGTSQWTQDLEGGLGCPARCCDFELAQSGRVCGAIATSTNK